MAKIKFTGQKPIWLRSINGAVLRFQPQQVTDVKDEEDVKKLLQESVFELPGKIGKTEAVPEPKTLSRPSKTLDEKEEAPEEQKPEKKEKVLKAKPKAKKPKLKKDKLRKKLQSKRTKK
jgi:hypothetical protein